MLLGQIFRAREDIPHIARQGEKGILVKPDRDSLYENGTYLIVFKTGYTQFDESQFTETDEITDIMTFEKARMLMLLDVDETQATG